MLACRLASEAVTVTYRAPAGGESDLEHALIVLQL